MTWLSRPYAYFVGSGRGLTSKLNRVNPDGTITALPITGGYPSGMAVDPTRIYWIGNKQYDIYAQPLSGGTASLVVPHAPVLGGLRTSLFADGDSLYYREFGSLSYLAFDDANVYYAGKGGLQNAQERRHRRPARHLRDKGRRR